MQSIQDKALRVNQVLTAFTNAIAREKRDFCYNFFSSGLISLPQKYVNFRGSGTSQSGMPNNIGVRTFTTIHKKLCLKFALILFFPTDSCSGLNTNMHVESLHKVSKHIYLKGKRIKRLD